MGPPSFPHGLHMGPLLHRCMLLGVDSSLELEPWTSCLLSVRLNLPSRGLHDPSLFCIPLCHGRCAWGPPCCSFSCCAWALYVLQGIERQFSSLPFAVSNFSSIITCYTISDNSTLRAASTAWGPPTLWGSHQFRLSCWPAFPCHLPIICVLL